MFDLLAKPFPPEKISWRIGSTNGDKTKGIALAYIDARDVMARLDEIVGPGNWQCDYPWTGEGKLCCRIGIKIDGEWIWKANGAGDTQVEAEKGAFSDAFKRAAVLWGIGQYLYDFPNMWVKIEPRGKSHFIPDDVLKDLTKQMDKWLTGKPVAPPKEQPKSFAHILAIGDRDLGADVVTSVIEAWGYRRENIAKVTNEEHIEGMTADLRRKYKERK